MPVCEEQRCDEAVFPLAIGILDQFLATCNIKKEQLQLVACVCLLLASKSRQCNHFSLELLSWYTDNSVSPQSLRTWELAILSQLNWDINVITANDFVDFILVRSANQSYNQGNKYSQIVRRHAVTFVALCSTEPRFVGWKPSLIAASAIYTAMKGMRREDTKLATGLAEMACVSVDQLMSISASIDQVISTEVGVVEQQTADSPHARNVGISATVAAKKAAATSCGYEAATSRVPMDSQDILV
ncbi:G1/S-specific cyclin-D3 [Orchesella cincta]|uniref:G1/S-specific cyclin-D3 n=1 Tax=Orchesella cincta TaxID=48709 RepID=A0A1D2NAQ5_ORCCI|nr:G1/S-specific cyclin-D3 [Orchesella cincta]